ncbi:MAG: hypothetical protein ABJA66_04945 [Actinomycetota bacterium]
MIATVLCLYLNAFAQSNTSQSENVITFCSLMKEPAKYLGQSVKIKDIYVAGFEQARFESGNTCAVSKEKRKGID